MAAKRRGPSFREIVDAVKAMPQARPPASEKPGIHADGTLITPSGRTYARATDDISATAAFDAARAGAQVVWDPCGCGGYCGLDWFDDDATARMVASGPPRVRSTKKAHGSIHEYRSSEEHVLLLVEGDVRWGTQLA